MKFAKELERDAVPEWRIKYLNYKAGKKYIKAVTRAVYRANGTPRNTGGQTPSFYTAQQFQDRRPNNADDSDDDSDGEQDDSFLDQTTSTAARQQTMPPKSIPMPQPSRMEDEALKDANDNLQYGSFVKTPPATKADMNDDGLFGLPPPAMQEPPSESREPQKPSDTLRKQMGRISAPRSASAGSVLTAKRNSDPDAHLLPKRAMAGQVSQGPSQLRRLLSHGQGINSRLSPNSRNGVNLQPFDLVREREAEFYRFMDSELAKVETFYKMKEEQAGQRLTVLREQLHEMRNRRIHEIAHNEDSEDPANGARRGSDNDRLIQNGILRPIKRKMFPPGPNSKAFQIMPRTPLVGSSGPGDGGRDYSRRPQNHDVSYRTAKRKLKLALHEFYRGLELLKSYALLNRTAFRKLNKKFDKAVNARPPYRYVNEKVNHAWFVSSDVLEGHIRAVEDLYARYFERGNHKLAAGKLRSLTKKQPEQSGSAFQSGFLIGIGLVFAVQGTVYAAQLLEHEDGQLRQETSYLLQIYGGYFLVLILFALFCLDCMVWTKSKINYPFIFEFDQRHHMEWQSLTAFPSFFLLLFGVFMWANFSRYGPESLYLYYPVALIGLTVLIILLPFPVLAHRSRRWLAYSHWRLLLAGLYPVEFRDFFLGDIYCSLTYATANIELFFCLYTNEWENPVRCNSSHSRLMGFLAALPPIWRFLQCIRRYRDTKNIFPHLVNCGKYSMTIMAAVTLSLYRINGTHANLALFITFSLINSIYCSIWDLFMDFSLVQADSKHWCLRDILALKRKWPYYTIMVIDPIIRFAWIFYAIFTHDRQHSTIVSFLVALMEVLRRGAWALFRVENEHCANVSQYKASRDVPLPYRIEPLMDRASAETSPTIPARESEAPTPAQPEEGGVTASSTAVGSTYGIGGLRSRAQTLTGRTFSRIISEAHKQDFEKRKRTPQEQEEAEHAGAVGDQVDDEEDDDEDDVDQEEEDFEVDMANELRRRAGR